MSDFQYYPTPAALARKAIEMFELPFLDGTGVLDPSAGEGHLLDAVRRVLVAYGKRPPLCGVEIDPERAEKLRASGVLLLGTDWFRVKSVPTVSHILMNPPFRDGAKHVLHAWKALWSGEIVAILNAETIRNPYTADRHELVRLIDLHGRIEECGKAFLEPGTLRPADVDVVIVHLVKHDTSCLDFDEIFGRMEADEGADLGAENGSQDCRELGFAKGEIEAMVERFDYAVDALRVSAVAGARASLACSAFGASFSETFVSNENGSLEKRPETEESEERIWLESVNQIARGCFAEQYNELKDRAWMGVYRMVKANSMLSHRAEQKLMASFETSIKPLAFTTDNIYSFLEGLIMSRTAMYEDMLLHVFDRIVQATPENVGVYRGWKSNSKHRYGMKMLPKRFILSGFEAPDYQKALYTHEADFLGDLDRAFAYLDGKRVEGNYPGSLESGFCHNSQVFSCLKDGVRWSFKYFDVRYYPKRGTIHFFPTKPELIDRMNLVVGKHRKWLPENVHDVQDAFWDHYNRAGDSKTAKKVWEAFDAERRKQCRSWSTLSYSDLFHENWDEHEKAVSILDKVVEETYAGLGYDLDAMMLPKHPEPEKQGKIVALPNLASESLEADEEANAIECCQAALF